jgi:hypothetical protein
MVMLNDGNGTSAATLVGPLFRAMMLGMLG